MKTQVRQGISEKRGEVIFRQKLASQLSKDGNIVFPDLRTHDEMLDVMMQRAAVTRDAMMRLCRTHPR